MTDLTDIERCAQVAEEAVAALKAMLKSPRSKRKHRYDRQTAIQIKYAIRLCARIATRIRAMNPLPPEESAATPMSDAALQTLRELRPVIAKTRGSHWKNDMLRRIDELVSP